MTLAAIARRYRVAEERVARLAAERDRLIREAAASGMSTRQIAREAGVSHQRVAQILNAAKERHADDA
jgi:DNA invertase Pin-like site-specific DNA recombinase